jgi:hypothetical protein
MAGDAPNGLGDLSALVAQEGGLLAQALLPEPLGEAAHGALVVQGPRARDHGADLALVVEAVREGYLLHLDGGSASRILRGDDADLALLAGDRLYAMGLERLAAAGDLEAVRALADVIALSAQALSRGDEALADAVWAAGCAEVGWGSSEDLENAKEAARAGLPDAAQQLRRAARHITGELALPR